MTIHFFVAGPRFVQVYRSNDGRAYDAGSNPCESDCVPLGSRIELLRHGAPITDVEAAEVEAILRSSGSMFQPRVPMCPVHCRRLPRLADLRA